jgi:hypothetical protein
MFLFVVHASACSFASRNTLKRALRALGCGHRPPQGTNLASCLPLSRHSLSFARDLAETVRRVTTEHDNPKQGRLS